MTSFRDDPLWEFHNLMELCDFENKDLWAKGRMCGYFRRQEAAELASGQNVLTSPKFVLFNFAYRPYDVHNQ